MELESDQFMTTKDVKVQIPSGNEAISGSGMEFQGAKGGLTRQPSMTKTNCLCSPTTHAGSFRCRLHRTPSLQIRTKGMDSASAYLNLSDQRSMLDATCDANKD